ncbi:PREDICTED: vomeronasal type-1 receptor 3-like [Chinchilla lanigera]|uniref:vomeronasal type-1 receptor 3-like n=1 Tax=Chinchilla lanigera TaxID=34839 RepID=UPI00038EBADE|nr:PREDICTED: vomeronasal type-1 receptor 3-like [Chinchilla lanigera]
MASTQVNVEMLFLVQIVIGTTGNFSLLSQYLILYVNGCKLRSVDWILRHLTVANTLVILSRGIPGTMAACGAEDFLSDVGCKLVFYVHRVGRGVSMGSTCLLSVFQAVTISPRSSRWVEFEVGVHNSISTFTALCWALNLILNITFPVQVTAKWKKKNTTNIIDFGYCSAPGDEKVLNSVNVALFSISDGICIGLLLCASGSMVLPYAGTRSRSDTCIRPMCPAKPHL